MDSNQIIDALGGSTRVAELCDVTVGAVSQWRHDGIPRARLQFLRLARPEVFGLTAREARRKHRPPQKEAAAGKRPAQGPKE